MRTDEASLEVMLHRTRTVERDLNRLCWGWHPSTDNNDKENYINQQFFQCKYVFCFFFKLSFKRKQWAEHIFFPFGVFAIYQTGLNFAEFICKIIIFNGHFWLLYNQHFLERQDNTSN